MLNSRRLLLMTFSLTLIMICISGCNRQPSQVPVLSTAISVTSDSVTPNPGLAIVRGRIVDKATQKVPIEGTLFLGQIQRMSNSAPIVQLDRAKAPYAIPESNGDFFFQNLKPGKYALIFYTPELNFLVNKPGSNDSLIFEVSPNQVINFGTIEITLQQ